MKPFKRSEETRRMVEFLRMHEKNAEVNYDELSRIAEAVIAPGSPKLVSARAILQRDHNAVWVCVKPKIGIRRLDDVEIAERLRPWWMRGARNKLRRAGKEIDVVDTRELDINQLARFGVDCVQRELAFNSLSRATRNRMERVARGTSNDLPAFNIVEWAISLTAPQPRNGK